MSLKMSVELGGTWMHCSKIPHILKNQLSRISEVDVCVCVCERERERESVCVCVCVPVPRRCSEFRPYSRVVGTRGRDTRD